MRYEFIVKGPVGEDLADALPELASAPYPTGGTSLFGPVLDQADVSTILARMRDLGISVVEVRRLPD